jgi:hypothetical protein
MSVDDQNRLNPMPLPLQMELMQDEETIDFDQKEYNNKMGRPDLNKAFGGAPREGNVTYTAEPTHAAGKGGWPQGGSSSSWGSQQAAGGK